MVLFIYIYIYIFRFRYISIHTLSTWSAFYVHYTSDNIRFGIKYVYSCHFRNDRFNCIFSSSFPASRCHNRMRLWPPGNYGKVKLSTNLSLFITFLHGFWNRYYTSFHKWNVSSLSRFQSKRIRQVLRCCFVTQHAIIFS